MVFFSVIVFFLLVVTIIEIMRKPSFTEKLNGLETVFRQMKNRFFYLSDILGS